VGASTTWDAKNAEQVSPADWCKLSTMRLVASSCILMACLTAAQLVVFKSAHVHGHDVVAPGLVVVDGMRIQAVGKGSAIPENASILDFIPK
jgi:hypothetical protein